MKRADLCDVVGGIAASRRALFLAAVGGGLLAMAYGACLQHDAHLCALQGRFNAFAQLPDSVRLDGASALGMLAGNGNHCDYFVGELRSSNLPRPAIEDFYAGKRLASGEKGRGESVELLFLPDEAPLSYVPGGWCDERVAEGESLFLIRVFTSEDPGYDLRCH